MLEASLDKLLMMIKDDKDRQVVMVILEGLAEIAAKAQLTMFTKESRLDEIMAMVKLVILEKVRVWLDQQSMSQKLNMWKTKHGRS